MEAVVIILVPLVALFIGTLAFFQPRPSDPVAEGARVDQHIAWLEERLAHARARNWDEQMMANLHAQLATARHQRRALSSA